MRIHRKEGTSLAVVVCISALLIAFSLTLIYTASLMLSSAQNRIHSEKSYQLAKSFGEILDEEIKDNTSFKAFCERFMSQEYMDYDPARQDVSIYRYQLTRDLDPEVGSVEVHLYKQPSGIEVDEDLQGVLFYTDAAECTAQVNQIMNELHYRYRLTVSVVANVQEFEYNYKIDYNCVEKLQPRFYHDGQLIRWNGSVWKIGEASDMDYDGIIDADNPVSYVLRTDTYIDRSFENVRAESFSRGGTP